MYDIFIAWLEFGFFFLSFRSTKHSLSCQSVFCSETKRLFAVMDLICKFLFRICLVNIRCFNLLTAFSKDGIQSISENLVEAREIKISISIEKINGVDVRNFTVFREKNPGEIHWATFFFDSINNWTFFPRTDRYLNKRENKRAYLQRKRKILLIKINVDANSTGLK